MTRCAAVIECNDIVDNRIVNSTSFGGGGILHDAGANAAAEPGYAPEDKIVEPGEYRRDIRWGRIPGHDYVSISKPTEKFMTPFLRGRNETQ